MREPRPVTRLRRLVKGTAWGSLVLAAGAGAIAYWLLGTASGARFALERAAALAGGRVAEVSGRLAGPLAVGKLEIPASAATIRARRLELDWSPLRLVGGELRVRRLHAASIEIETVPSTSPARAPATLVAPIRLYVDHASTDRVSIASRGAPDEGFVLRDVALRLAADEAAWFLGDAQATTPAGRVKLGGSVGASAPFRLDLKGELEGVRRDASYRAAIAAGGHLGAIELRLTGREGALAGSALARVAPFGELPLRALEARFSGLDLAAFGAWPHTQLALEANLAPQTGALLEGPVSVTNAAAGAIDQQRVPVASAKARVAIGRDRVQATDLAVAFAGGGRAEGRAAWAEGKVDAKLAVRDADLKAWHSALRGTRLAGDIACVATAEAQSFDVALADPRFEIRGDARIAGGRLTVGRARLARGAAAIEAGGSLELSGRRKFEVQGTLAHVDPAAYANTPAGDLNGRFVASGTLAGVVAGEASLDLAQSRIAALEAAGHVAVTIDGGRLARAQADLAVGETRFNARGALGRPGDALEAKLVSPDLAPLARLFGLDLAGRANVDAKLEGAFGALSGRVAIEANKLALPGGLSVGAVRGQVELGAGEEGLAAGRLEVAGVRRAGQEADTLSRALLTLKGTRPAHEIAIAADLPERTNVRALLAGGLVAGAALPEWRGRVESFDVEGATSFALAAPAPLTVSSGRVELGEALLSGEAGRVRLEETRWTPASLRLRGSSSAMVVRAVRRLLVEPGEFGSTLVLAADWDLTVAESMDGFVSVRRERGDVRLGEPRQALGLETVALRADVTGGHVVASMDLRGSRIGRWTAQADATLRRGDGGWEVSPVAPLSARFEVDVPDLAWMAAWVGPEARTAGRLRGEGRLEGTARDPSWSGRLELSQLSMREPTLGAEVKDGTIVVALKDREARLERFDLSMPWEPPPEAARAIGEAKRPERGTLTASGYLDLGTRKGLLQLKATAFPVTRLPTRFLAATGEGRAELDGTTTTVTGNFTADAGWFGIPDSAPPSISEDVVVVRGRQAPPAEATTHMPVRVDLRIDLGRHVHFQGRGLSTRLAGSLRMMGEVGPHLRTTGAIRAVGGTYDAYGRTLTLERGVLNFQGPVDNPGLNVLALRKGLPVEAGVEISGTVARPQVRLVSTPDVPEPEKLAWLVLGRGQGDVTAADATLLLSAANSLLGVRAPGPRKILGGLGIDELRVGQDTTSVLGTMPQKTVAGSTSGSTTKDVVTVGATLTDDIRVTYQQGLADTEGSLLIAYKYNRHLQFILRAGYLQGFDAAYRFSFW